MDNDESIQQDGIDETDNQVNDLLTENTDLDAPKDQGEVTLVSDQTNPKGGQDEGEEYEENERIEHVEKKPLDPGVENAPEEYSGQDSMMVSNAGETATDEDRGKDERSGGPQTDQSFESRANTIKGQSFDDIKISTNFDNDGDEFTEHDDGQKTDRTIRSDFTDRTDKTDRSDHTDQTYETLGPKPSLNIINEILKEPQPKMPLFRRHEWIYKRASPVLRNPFNLPSYPPGPKLCGERQLLPLTTDKYAGPDRRRGAIERLRARRTYMDNSSDFLRVEPNPVVTVPMRAQNFKRSKWSKKLEESEDSQAKQKREEEERKAHERAVKLGYETLVGNIVYYGIPGAKDLNRSWRHFLDKDPMAWGFPYAKGSKDRPSLPLPAPYLVHQLREHLWRFPRNRLIARSVPEDES